MKILIVEDDDSLSALLKKGLAKEGYSVPETAGSAEEALALTEKHSPDLVVMDVQIRGGVDGIELASRLRETFYVPVIFLTAREDHEALERAKRSYPYAYLVKPFDIKDLKTAIEISLAKAKHDREIEALLAEKEVILQNSLVGICHIEDKKFVSVNQRFREMFGLTEDDVAAHPSTAFVFADPARFRQVYREIRAAFRKGKPHRFTERFRRKSGEEFWCECFGKQISSKEKISGSIWVLADVTEQKTVVATLTSSEKRYRDLVQYCPSAIYLQTDGIITFSNQAGLTLLGAPRLEDLTGRHMGDFFPEDEKEARRSIFGTPELEAMESAPLPIETRMIHLSGKPLHVEVSAIRYLQRDGRVTLLFVNNITERKRAEHRAGYLAYYDSLTGLANRKLLFYRMELEMLQAEATESEILLVTLGLDRFSQINELMGHAFGDQLLLSVSERLKTVLEKDDLLSKISGDEFVFLLHGVWDGPQLNRVAKNILGLFLKPFDIAGKEISMTASLGITVYPRDADDKNALFKNCDLALKQAKANGRNTFQLFNKEMNTQLLRISELEQSLKESVKKLDFDLHYQPKVNTRKEIVGAECLLRWKRSGHGPVSPAEFIPIMEDTKQIIPVGYWVLEEACRQNKAWQKKGHPKICVSVNLSMHQFRDPDLVQTIRSILSATDLEPEYLELEITESGVMRDEDDTLSRLRELHDIGIKISIDDFGTGYSSLAKLLQLPIDILKIDKSFIDRMTESLDASKLVTMIIQLARTLRLETVAEGVETEEQFAMIRDMGCDIIQGFFFSRPIPAESLEEYLREGLIEGKNALGVGPRVHG